MKACIGLLAAVVGVSGCRVTTPAASVRFLVVTPAGEAVPYRVHEFFNEDKRRAFDGLFKSKSTATGVPYGRYSYTLVRTDLKSPAWSTLQGKVDVREQDVMVTLIDRNRIEVVNGIEVLVEDAASSRIIKGVVASVPEAVNRAIWVRLLNVFTNVRIDRVLASNGEFSAEIEPGSWLVLLLHGESLLRAESFILETKGNESFVRYSTNENRTIQLFVQASSSPH